MVVGALVDIGVGLAKKIGDRFFPKSMDETERAAADRELLAMVQAHDTAVVEAQRDVLVAELTQGDNFTKRARPWMIYAGLIVVGFNTIGVSLLNGLHAAFGSPAAAAFASIDPGQMFWTAWGGAASIYVWRRDATKQLGMKLARNGVKP